MNLWLLFIVIGGLTLVERLSFIVIADRWAIPPIVTRALRYVPVTALTALAIPAIVLTDGAIDLSVNPKIIAGLVAIVVAWRTHNMLLTIIFGMVAFWVSGIVFTG